MLINVVDASNLERNLYLTLQLLELGIPCVVALNMLDIAEKQQVRIDIDALAARLGCPVNSAGIDSRTGIEALKIALDRHQANSDLELVHYPQPLLREADLLAQQMSAQIPPGSGAGWVCRCWRAISTAGPMPATPPINWISPGESQRRDRRPGAAHR